MVDESAAPEHGPGGTPGPEERSWLQLLVLLALGLGALYLVGLLLAPFLPALVTSAIVAALVYPAYARFEGWVGFPNLAAFVGTVVVFFLLLVPLVALSLILVDQVRFGIDWVAQQSAGLFATGGRIRDWLEAAAGYLGMDAQGLTRQLSSQAQTVLSTLAGRTLNFLSGLAGWLLQGAVALFTLFYLLRDGERLMDAIEWLLPLDAENSRRLIARARDVTYATVYGHVAVAVVQGVLGGLIFWILGIPASALWGTLMGIVSLLPAIGPPVVWLPASLILIYTGDVVEGIVLLAFGVLVISTVDNLLRAYLVSGRAHLHPLVVFFSVLGGLFVFGAVGFFVGPVLFVLAVSVLEIARVALEPERGVPDAVQGGFLLQHVTTPAGGFGSPGDDASGGDAGTDAGDRGPSA